MHIGHLFLAEEVMQFTRCKQILLIPSHTSAHKNDETSVDPEQRLLMMRQAVKEIAWLTVDDCEIRRGGISYTWETVLELKHKYDFPDKPGLVIGDDLVGGFHKWKYHTKLLEETEIIIARRFYEEKLSVSFPHCYLNNTILPIASSDIRERIREKRAYRFLLTESVYSYIVSKKLYSVPPVNKDRL